MSDQDDISALLAQANAEQQAGSAPTPPETAAAQAVAPAARKPRPARDNGDVLGVSWLYGDLHMAVFRRQKMVKEWSCRESIATVEAFEGQLDAALESLDFAGTEMFLLLENDLFSHQTENAPGIAKAAEVFLQRRVERLEKEHEPMLWVSQPAVPIRQEQAYVLHLLPRSFYDQLNRVLLARRLDLTRILPLVVPLQRELNKMPIGKDTPMLLVADVGETTALTVGRVGGPLLFYRTILAALRSEPARVGVEVNRSVLYAKQQFGANIEHIWILATSGRAASQVQAKAGADKRIVVLPTSPTDWLQTAIKLPARQPVNLLRGYLRRKRRRVVARWALLFGCWLGVGTMAWHPWKSLQSWKAEQAEFAALAADEANLLAERNRLLRRNTALESDERLLQQIVGERLPPVPERFLRYLGAILPVGVRLTEFSARWETGENASGRSPHWAFRLDGVIEGDAETGRQILAGFQGELSRSPLRARFDDSKRTMTRHLVGTDAGAEVQRFSLTGGVLED